MGEFLESQLEQLARAFVPDAELDGLLILLKNKPEEFAGLPAKKCLEVGHYKVRKEAHEQMRQQSAATNSQ